LPLPIEKPPPAAAIKLIAPTWWIMRVRFYHSGISVIFLKVHHIGHNSKQALEWRL
jgi:hypothetical protein